VAFRGRSRSLGIGERRSEFVAADRCARADRAETVAADLHAILESWPRSDDDVASGEPVKRYGPGPRGGVKERSVASTSAPFPRIAFPSRPRASESVSTGGRLIYIVGDVHGCYALLLDLLSDIAADMTTCSNGRRPTLIFCGDYIDRGPESAQVLEAISHLRCALRNDVLLLKGNHEHALLQFLDNPSFGDTWMQFGGGTTLRSYGVEAPPAQAHPSEFEPVRNQLLNNMPAMHLRTVQTLDLMVIAGDYAFVHAGVAPGSALHRQVELDLLWIGPEFLESDKVFEKIIVHGHSWIDENPVLLANRIGVDTGAYRTGVLSALRIDGGDVKLLQAKDPAICRSARKQSHLPLVPRPPSYVGSIGALTVATGGVAEFARLRQVQN
jgi:serine/threonine protein phosphatase 1